MHFALTKLMKAAILYSVIELRKPVRPATRGVSAETPLLICYSLVWGGEMPVPKPFLSYTQQMDKLVNEKNLQINDRTYAEEVLKQISYFALISGYKDLYRNPTTKKYKDGTTFEEIVALYNYDISLRELFLKYLLQIERNMRSLMSYYFTELHGENQSQYLLQSNYDATPRKVTAVNKLIGILSDIANISTDYEYINYQRRTYHNVPLWVLVNVLTFGNISKMYECFTQNLQSKVSKNFQKINEKEMAQYLKVLTKFRNVCAHNERLFSYRTRNDIPDTSLHQKMTIRKRGTVYVYGKCDLFSVVIAFRYMLPKDDFLEFKRNLGKIIDNFCTETTRITEAELLDKMGFPYNWKKISTYKI